MATTVISGSSSISNKTLTDVLVSGSDAMLYVRSGGRVVSATTTNNGNIYLISGGKCEIASFLSGGELFIYSGSASKVNIGSGGFLGIDGDGSKSNSVAIAYTTTISSGGTMLLNYAGAANGTTVLNGGQLTLGGYSSSFGSYAYNYAFDTTLSGGSMAIKYKARAEKNFIYSSIYSSGRLFVASGGTATSNYVGAGGSLIVDGSATSNYIYSGGYMGVESGGIASSNTVYADGRMNVWRGGKASSTVMFGGMLILYGESYSGTYSGGSVTIAPGGYSFKEVFSSGTFLVNGSTSNGSRAEGNVSSGTIGSGVTMNINGGRFVGTTVSSAIINVTTGYADLTNLSGAVATIKGGTFYASSGGVMKSAVISGYGNGTSMGTMYVMSGATVNTVNVYESAHLGIMTGGSVTYASASVEWASYSASIGVSSGGRLGLAFVYGGMLDIGSGGSVTSAIIANRGKAHVSGTLGAAIVSSGCPVQVSSGGAVNSALINEGGRINVNGGTLGSAYVAFGAILSINSNGSVGSATVSGSAQVNMAGKAAGLNIRSGGRLQVSGGPGSAVARDFRVSGRAQVCEGGSLLSGSVNSGGRIDVEYGGTAGSCTVSAGGMLRIYRGGMLHDISVLSGGKITGNYNCSDFTWSSGAVADMDITDFLPDNPSAFVTNLNYAKSKSVVFTLSVYASQTKGTYRLASGAAGFDKTITVQNTAGTELGTLSVGEIVDIGGVNYRLNLGGGLLSVTVGAVASTNVKSDIDGNGISDVMFQYTGGDYQLGFWMNGTNEWKGNGLPHPAEWEVLGAYDMNANGKADSVLVGNVEVGGVKGAYIGYYADSDDRDANWVNIGYLTNENNIDWKNAVGNLTGNASGVNSIVWYTYELGALGVWTDGTESWVQVGSGFDATWTLIGCGDFNGDGKDQIVMAHNSGAEYYAIDIGGTWTNLGASDSGWEVRAIGDFKGDGKDDIVAFHKETGIVAMWGDGNSANWSQLGQLNANDWFVVGAGDYNADAKDDLLVRQKSTGMLGYYSGANMSAWTELGRGVDMNWTVIA